MSSSTSTEIFGVSALLHRLQCDTDMSESSSPKRPRLDYDESKDEHYNKNRDPDDVSTLSQPKTKKVKETDDEASKEDEIKSKSVNIETARREHHLVMRLTNKEQELQDCMNQMSEMKQAQTQNTAQLRSMLLDPAINLVFQRMAREMDEHKEKLKQKQNELSAWKFTPDSQTGMRLMAKCRMLLTENGELGKMISSGRTARLEGEIALHKALVTEMKTNQKELDEFVGELEEDVEGMQGMIFMLQQQLKEAREQISRLQQENEQLRTLRMPLDPEPGGNHYSSSGNNTPQHDWPEHSNSSPSTNHNMKSSAPQNSHTLGSSSLFGSACENSGSRTTSTVPPPALSTLSNTFRNFTSSEQIPAVQTSDEEINGGSVGHKLTPDSGLYTQDEDTSMDTTDVTSNCRTSGPGSLISTHKDFGNASHNRTNKKNDESTTHEDKDAYNSCDTSKLRTGRSNGPDNCSLSPVRKIVKPPSGNPFPKSDKCALEQTEESSDDLVGLNGCTLLRNETSNKVAEINLERTNSTSVNMVRENTSPGALQKEACDRTDSEMLQYDDSKCELNDLAVSSVLSQKVESQTKLLLVNGNNKVV